MDALANDAVVEGAADGAVGLAADLMVEEGGIVGSAFGGKHFMVGDVFVYAFQLALVEPHEGVEPKQCFCQLAQQEVEGVALAHMYCFMPDELFDFNWVETVSTDDDVVAKREGGGVVDQLANLDAVYRAVRQVAQTGTELEQPHGEQNEHNPTSDEVEECQCGIESVASAEVLVGAGHQNAVRTVSLDVLMQGGLNVNGATLLAAKGH